MNWIYLDDSGNRHRIGLYHGDKSGHLVIYCNLKVVQVDFSVKSTQMYSFFVEDELCEVHVVQEKDGSFGYAFKINKEVDTPRNRERKVVRGIERKHIAIALGLMLVFIAGALLFNRYQKEKRMKAFLSENSVTSNLSMEDIRQIRMNGKPSVATFYLVNAEGQEKMSYSFKTSDSTRVTGSIINGSRGYMLPNGFELFDQDQFAVSYLPDNPQTHRIDFFEPKENTVRHYLKTAVKKEQELHTDQSFIYCECLVETVLKHKSWRELSIIINQPDSTSQTKQDKFLRNQYLRLIREPELAKQIREACWDQ